MKKHSNTLISVLATWFISATLFLAVLGLAEWLTVNAVSPNIISVIRGVLLSILFASLAWVMVRNGENPFKTIGLNTWSKNLTYFGLGLGLLLVPLLLTIFFSNLAGWASYQLNQNSAIVERQLLVLLVVFLFEAFPEEIIFRGVIFGKLAAKYNKWKSSIITVALFVLFPIFVFPIQKLFMSGPIVIGGNEGITIGYLIYMTIFGFFTAGLRVFTKNIWTSIGFHLLFVSMNHLMGIHNKGLIVITDYSNELSIQLIFLVSLILMGSILYW